MNRNRRIKYCWGASRVVRGKWVLGVICRYERSGNLREGGFAVSVRGLLIWLTLIVLVLYAAWAGLVLLRWRQNPHFAVTYADAVFAPVRGKLLAEKRGQALLAEGQEHFKAKRWEDAEDRLQRGLAAYPRDTAARVSLAQVYLQRGAAPQAEQLLKKGLGDSFPGRAYLELLFDLAEVGEDFEFVAQRGAQYLPELKQRDPNAELPWLVQRRFAALLAGGRPEEALALAETVAMNERSQEQQVIALLAAGRAADAVTRLAQWRGQPGADARKILPLQVRAWREAGALDAMERGLQEWRVLAPTEPDAAIQGVVQRALAGRAEAANAAFDEFMRGFGASAEHLARLTAAVGAIDQAALLRRCAEAAQERGFPPQRVQMLLVHACVHQGDWLAAGRAFIGIMPQKEGAPIVSAAWRGWMQGLLACVQGQRAEADAAFITRLRDQQWPVQIWRESVEALIRAERFTAARDVIALAAPAFPASQWFKTKETVVKMEIMARTEALPADAAPRAPVPAEQLFVLRLEDLLRAERWEEAATHVHSTKALRPVPAWLEAQAGRISLAEVRIAHGQGNSLGMMKAARLYLNGDDERTQRLLEQARSFIAAGDRASAVSLAREIASRAPRDVAARAALEEWEPPLAQKPATAPRLDAKLEQKVSAARQEVESADDLDARLKELQTRATNGDLLGMLALARSILTGDRARSDGVLEAARALYAAGERRGAVLLAREVARKSPNYPPATRLLAEWERAGKK